MDLQSSLFDPIYTVQGVSAVLIGQNGSALGDVTVLDKSFGQVLSRKARRHRGTKFSKGSLSALRLDSFRPYACIRNAEVMALGKVAGDLVNAFVRFNGGTYRIESYLYRPTTNGVDDGEVLLILSDASDILSIFLIGQIDGNSTAVAALAAWLQAQSVSQSTLSAVLATFIRAEVAGAGEFSAVLGAWLVSEAPCLSEFSAVIRAWLSCSSVGQSTVSAVLSAFLRGEVESEADLSGVISAWLDGQDVGEGDLSGTLPAWLIGSVIGQSVGMGTIRDDANARCTVDGTLRETTDGQIRVVV